MASPAAGAAADVVITTVTSILSAEATPEAIAPAAPSWPIFSFIRSTLFQFLKFWTYTLPSFAFGWINTTLTFTISLTTLCTIFVMLASFVLWVVRYRVLNVQSDVAPEPQRQQPEVELPPEPQEGDSKPGLSSYLDEFLSAIKIFGYLERPVFHELTRSMQTRKLIAGETFLLEEEKGFCLVVDGLVQIFTKANNGNREEFQPAGIEGFDEDSEHERDASGYQLLTEVKNGAPMSSLFTILSLFTEDVTLKREDSGDDSTSRDGSYMTGNGFEDGESFNPARADRGGYQDARPYGAVPPMSLADEYQGEYFPATPEKPTRPQRPKLKKSHSVHPDIIARASVDTTIAVIPASAFRRLTRVYPKASGHIVQVILTRFQRVTFLTAYSYLGLTSEVLRTEKLMSYYTNYQLPNDLRGAPLENLKKRFDKERERLGPDEDESKGIALLKSDHKRRRSSATLRKEVVMHARMAAISKGEPAHLGGPVGMKKSFSGEGENASDTARLPFSHNAPPFSQGWTTSQPSAINLKISTSPTDYHPELSGDLSKNEDSQFQMAVSDCLFKALGLNQRNGSVAQRTGIDSGDHSPRLVTYSKQKAMFSNAFGFIDPYEGSHDGDTESVASTGTGHHNNPSVHEELKRDVEIVFFPKGSVLVEQGERTPGIYYVIDGFLDVGIPVDEKAQDKNVMGGLDATDMVQPDDLPPLTRTTTSSSAASGKRRKTTRKSLYMVKPGGVAGYMGSISAYRSFVDVRAQTDVYVGFVPASALERIVERNPVVLLTMAKRLTSLLPRLILHIDFALEWLQVSAGQVVYHQEEESDAIYIVLNGRMRAILEDKDDGVKVLGEYGQGESVGELEVLTETTRPATLHAIRDTELAKFPRTLFNSLALEHPGITIQISKIIASRMRSLIHGANSEKSMRSSVGMVPSRKGNNVNLRTVCILPVTAGVPVTEFAHRLTTALHQTGVSGNVVMLNQATVLNHLGRHAFSRMGKLKLAGHLADLEEKYGMVLYVCDTNVNSPWTQTCIAQADEILLVALAEGETGMGEFERVLLKMGSTARKSLVLIHGERFCREGLTRRWLENRRWISGGHHHIQMSYRPAPEEPLHTFHHTPANKIGSAIKQRVQILQAEIFKYTSRRVRNAPQYASETPFKSDFHRLARRLCGKAIGLVLGGGGARGLAHVGIIRAMEDSGIPVDVVAGTSIGALIGGLYARDADIVTLYGRTKQFASRMASTWRMVLDLTYPAVSYTTGYEFNRTIFRAFNNSQVEDFWLPYFCNTTNITQSRMQVHQSGIAWRPIRASMSLAGLLPPLPDAKGDLLLDGGYVDNLPVDSMRDLYGTTTIFAIDVSSIDDNSPHHYGDALSGWWVFLNRWNPFKFSPNPPTLAEIQQRLAYVSSVEALEKAKVAEGVVYCRVPVEKIGTLEFGRVEEVVNIGFHYAKGVIEKLREKGELEGIVPGGTGVIDGGKTGWRGRRVGRRKSI